MKIIGMLDTRNDGDMLKDVLDQLKGEIDYLYAYDDGSWDNTGSILKAHDLTTCYWNRNQFLVEELDQYLQHRRGFVFDEIKKDFKDQDAWIVRIEGDRFFINQSPREIVDRAIKVEQNARSGVMLDFVNVDWTEQNDTWPKWNPKEIMHWYRLDDIHTAVAFKVSKELVYNRQRPWPNGNLISDYNPDNLTTDMAYFAHYGKRSPTYLYWSIMSGNRKASVKYKVDYSSPTAIKQTFKHQYRPSNVLHWVDWPGLQTAINENSLQNTIVKREDKC